MSFAKAKRFSCSTNLRSCSEQNNTPVSERKRTQNNKKTAGTSGECGRYSLASHQQRSNEEVKPLVRSSLPKREGKKYPDPSYADILQHKGFGEENEDEITLYFPYKDDQCVDNSQKRISLTDIRDDLTDVQKRFKDLYLRKKEVGSADIDVCIAQIRKALGDADERVKDAIESAITEIESEVDESEEGTEKYKLIQTSVILLKDTKGNIESCMYLLARNVAKVLNNEFPSFNENQGFTKSFKKLITKLEMSKSEAEELELAQRKIIEQEETIKYLMAELNSDEME